MTHVEGLTCRNMEFTYFMDTWNFFKVWSASGGFVVALSTRRIKDAPIVLHVLTSDFFSSAAFPSLEVHTMMK